MEFNVSFSKSFTEIWSLIHVILDNDISRNENAEQAKGGIYIRQICKECLMEVVQDSIYISRY